MPILLIMVHCYHGHCDFVGWPGQHVGSAVAALLKLAASMLRSAILWAAGGSAPEGLAPMCTHRYNLPWDPKSIHRSYF